MMRNDLLPEDEIGSQWYDFLFDLDPMVVYVAWLLLAVILSLIFCWILTRSGIWMAELKGKVSGGNVAPSSSKGDAFGTDASSRLRAEPEGERRAPLPAETLSRLRTEWEQARILASGRSDLPPLQRLALALVEVGSVSEMDREKCEGWAEVLMKESGNRVRVVEILERVGSWLESA